AQTGVPTERKTTIVPPGKRAAALLEQAVGVVQAQCQQALEGCPLGWRYQNIADPLGRVVNVLVSWGNIIVAQNGQTGILLQFFFQPVVQGGEPFQLVGVLLALQRLPVGAVGTNYAYRAVRRWVGGGQQTLLWVFVIGQIALHIRARLAGNQSHAVISFLTRPVSVISQFLKSLQGKTLVGQFELLQTKHVYGVGG